ncbi:hypothetical protein ANN_20413 [Periplaneta americana]|uniref:Uncharacterized protein n=1 Tax=Periplaneta americana TaxID=6978 RepID=A0ABQ8SCV1_PERAM|nr:hypothetical protein ANN_20413 [Periplaneta americana]
MVISGSRRHVVFEIYTESYDACEEGTLHHSDVDYALGIRMSADTSNIVSPMTHAEVNVVVIIEDVQNVHLLLEYRPHMDGPVSLVID